MSDPSREELNSAYIKAENAFSHAYRQMMYWTKEAERTNAAAAKALRDKQAAEKEDV